MNVPLLLFFVVGFAYLRIALIYFLDFYKMGGIMRIENIINRWLEKDGNSVAKLSELSGVPLATIYRVRANGSCTVRTWQKISKVIGDAAATSLFAGQDDSQDEAPDSAA